MSLSVRKMTARSSNSARRGVFPKKDKYIPERYNDVIALAPSTDTMKGVLEWLKTERLHKYWPIFSRLKYAALVNLSEDNFEAALAAVGARHLTSGARGRILRCAQRLRSRARKLREIKDDTKIEDAVETFKHVLTTPLSDEPVPDGAALLNLLRQKINLVMAVNRTALTNQPFRAVLRMYSTRREIRPVDRRFATVLLSEKMCRPVVESSRRTLQRQSAPVSPHRTTLLPNRARPSSWPDSNLSPGLSAWVPDADSVFDMNELLGKLPCGTKPSTTQAERFSPEPVAAEVLPDKAPHSSCSSTSYQWPFDNDEFWTKWEPPVFSRAHSKLDLWTMGRSKLQTPSSFNSNLHKGGDIGYSLPSWWVGGTQPPLAVTTQSPTNFSPRPNERCSGAEYGLQSPVIANRRWADSALRKISCHR